MIEEMDEFDLNHEFISECCGAPIQGEIYDDVGLCSQCGEWSGIVPNKDEE